jgi:hypothetical protein
LLIYKNQLKLKLKIKRSPSHTLHLIVHQSGTKLGEEEERTGGEGGGEVVAWHVVPPFGLLFMLWRASCPSAWKLKNRDWSPQLGEISYSSNAVLAAPPESLVRTEDGTEARRYATAGWCQQQRRGHGAGTPILTSRELHA